MDRIGACERGENPMVLVKMKSGFAVIGDNQFLSGYCVLLGWPKASSLNELPMQARAQYLTDMTLIGDAILTACNPLRINYSILMNSDHYLHAHIEARYDWEPEEFRSRPSYCYPKEQRYSPEYAYSEAKYGPLKQRIAEALQLLMAENGDGQ